MSSVVEFLSTTFLSLRCSGNPPTVGSGSCSASAPSSRLPGAISGGNNAEGEMRECSNS
jgi:hypothetical protein